MAHEYSSSNTVESESCPGVKIILKRMSEGRRLELRRLIAEPNRKILDIMREQDTIQRQPEETRDMVKYLELGDSYDSLMLETINPAWIKWGVKAIEGLVVDGRPLSVEDMLDWPSVFFNEVLTVVRAEAELNGAQRKNSLSDSTPGDPGPSTQKPSSVEPAEKKGGGGLETAPFTTPIM